MAGSACSPYPMVMRSPPSSRKEIAISNIPSISIICSINLNIFLATFKSASTSSIKGVLATSGLLIVLAVTLTLDIERVEHDPLPGGVVLERDRNMFRVHDHLPVTKAHDLNLLSEVHLGVKLLFSDQTAVLLLPIHRRRGLIGLLTASLDSLTGL